MKVCLDADFEKSLKYNFEKNYWKSFNYFKHFEVYVLKVIMRTPFEKKLLKLFHIL